METLECTSSLAIAAITDDRMEKFKEKFEREIQEIAITNDHRDQAEVKAHISKTTKTGIAANYKTAYGIELMIKGEI